MLVGVDHPLADLGVTAYKRSVTADVLGAARSQSAMGTALASVAGLSSLRNQNPLQIERNDRLLRLIGVGHGASFVGIRSPGQPIERAHHDFRRVTSSCPT